MIKATVIADSKNEFGNRITTMVVTFPRIILAELNTHRMFSRNSASSRAIPFEKMVKSVEETPFIPMAWQTDHKGMQGTQYLDETASLRAVEAWTLAKESAILWAKNLHNEDNVTKQLCNRLLEPFMYHTVIITATEWENFFALRCPKYKFTNNIDKEGKFFRSRKDTINYAENQFVGQGKLLELYSDLEWLKANTGQAEIHMMALAEAMWDEYQNSVPLQLKENQWHIPFIEVIED